jgi:prepilin-type N-terminal cleavage/methylation domain-containing protein
VTEVARERRSGFTLIEIIVVLVVMLIAVGVVAPAFLPPEPADTDALAEPLRVARRLALTRGETVYLDLRPTGDWSVQGASSLSEGALARGRVDRYEGRAATIVASPLGTCAYDVQTTAAGGGAPPLDPLSCTLEQP